MTKLESRVAVRDLENKLRALIVIPDMLKNNINISTTALGGTFIHYRSNSANRLMCENSKVQLTMYIDVGDTNGNYIGDVAGLEITREWGIKGPRGIKKHINYIKVIEKINKWMADNTAILYMNIENK